MKFCPDCRNEAKYSKGFLSKERRLKKLIWAAKNRATTKSVPFDIDYEYLIQLWDIQNGKCAISGRNLDLQPFGYKGQVNPNAPSVDRITPALGYTKDNVRIVCYQVNVALSEFGENALLQLCSDILAFRGI